MTDPGQRVLDRLCRVFTPRPPMNIWQWADEYRQLGKGISAKSRHGAARYSTKDAPHQRGIMEAFTDPAVQTTVMIGASQVCGKTEMFNNVIGYHMEYKPTNVIVMYPTIDSAEKYSKKKFMPMCRATPELDRLLPNNRTRDSGNTILVKEYSGGSVFFVGANSPASLRGSSGEILLADEIDSNEPSAGIEGDAVALLFKRGESYSTCVQAVSSTPTIEGSSRIWSWWESSDQRLWFVPCQKCGTMGIFKWSPESAIKAGPSFYVEWPAGRTRDAVIVCSSCGARHDDAARLDMYFRGEWRATAPFHGIRGFHLSWIYCPWPAKKGFAHRLHQMAEEWERAKKGGRESLKVIVNTGLCETWKLQLEGTPDPDRLALGMEAETGLNDLVVFLTASVDAQKDRLEYEIQGWGIGEESWGIETGKIHGNPHQPEVWQRLDAEVLSRTFTHPCGAVLRISCALIDSGGQSDAKAFSKPVYDFVLRRQGRHVFACKGSSEAGAPIVVARPQKSGIVLQMVGTDAAKSVIYERLTVAVPGPGYCHFLKGCGYDEEWFRQLTAEGVSVEGGKRRWVKRRDRNEALDLRCYGYAAFELRRPNLAAISRNIRAGAVPQAPGQSPPAPKLPARRRINFVKW